MAGAPPDYAAIWDHDVMPGYSLETSFRPPFDAVPALLFQMRIFKRVGEGPGVLYRAVFCFSEKDAPENDAFGMMPLTGEEHTEVVIHGVQIEIDGGTTNASYTINFTLSGARLLYTVTRQVEGHPEADGLVGGDEVTEAGPYITG